MPLDVSDCFMWVDFDDHTSLGALEAYIPDLLGSGSGWLDIINLASVITFISALDRRRFHPSESMPAVPPHEQSELVITLSRYDTWVQYLSRHYTCKYKTRDMNIVSEVIVVSTISGLL